jgi:hypothetical protein
VRALAALATCGCDVGVLAECLEAGETFANAFVEEAIEAGV